MSSNIVPMQSRRGKQTLEAWIAEAAQDDEKGGQLTSLALVHMQGAGQREVHVCRLGSGKQWTHKSLADMFTHKANAYAQDLPGVQTFQLLAFYGGKGEPEASHPFVVGGEVTWNGLASESPDARGQTQQGMRLTEAIVQGTFRQIGSMFDASQRMIDTLTAYNAKLMQENRDAFEIVKDVLMQKALDDRESKMKLLEYQRSSAERKKMLSFAPALINQVLGREVFPQSTADTALVEMVAESLSEEDFMKLSGIIKPELLGPLAERFTQIMKKRAEEKALAGMALDEAVLAKTEGGES